MDNLQEIADLHNKLDDRNFINSLSGPTECNDFIDTLIDHSFTDPSLLTHDNLNSSFLFKASSCNLNDYCNRLVSLSIAKNEDAKDKLSSIAVNLSAILDERTLNKVAQILPNHESVKHALRVQERKKIRNQLSSKDKLNNLSLPELDNFFGQLLDHSKEDSKLILSKNITPDLLSKISSDNLHQFLTKLKEKATEVNNGQCGISRDAEVARNKLSSCLDLHILQRLNLAMLTTLQQEFPDRAVLKQSLLNRTRLENGIASRQIAVNAVKNTLVVTTSGALAAGATSLAVVTTHTASIAAATATAAGFGVVFAGVGVTAGTVGGAVSVGAYSNRGITNEWRKKKELMLNNHTFNLNHPTQLAKLCDKPNLDECPEFPDIIDHAIQFSNELYGIPRTRDSIPLAKLSANPSLASMPIRSQDVVLQAIEISASYNGQWPIYSDISPLAGLCDNIMLFKLTNPDKVVRSVLELAQTNQEYFASSACGYHLLPLKKLANNPDIASLSPDKLSELKKFCHSTRGLTHEMRAFSIALQTSLPREKEKEELKKLQEKNDKQNEIIERLLREMENMKEEFSDLTEKLSLAQHLSKKAGEVLKKIVEGKFVTQDDVIELWKHYKELEKTVSGVQKDYEDFKKELCKMNEKIDQNQKDIVKLAKQQGLDQKSIQTFCDDLKKEMTIMKEGNQEMQAKLDSLSKYEEVLEMISTPEAVKALSDILEGHYASKDHRKDMDALHNRLLDDPRLSNHSDKISQIMKFSDNYHKAWMCLYQMSPMLATGVIKTEAGRKTFIKTGLSSFVKIFSTSTNNPLIQTIGAAYEDILKNSADESSRKLMFGIKSLGIIADGKTIPEDRTDAEKERIASDILSMHTIELALHLAKDPEKITIHTGEKKLKSYCQKTFDGIKGISDNIQQINAGNSPQLQGANNLNPKAIAASYMTRASLAAMYNFFPNNAKARATISRSLLESHNEMRTIKPQTPTRQTTSLATRADNTFGIFHR